MHAARYKPMVLLCAVTMLLLTVSGPVAAHDGEHDTPGVENEDDLVYGRCRLYPPAFLAPLAVRVFPAVPDDARIVALDVAVTGAPITAIEIPYRDWRGEIVDGRARARRSGENGPETVHRFWFWIGTSTYDPAGGTLEVEVEVTLDDGRRIAHVLDDTEAVRYVLDDSSDRELPRLQIPYRAGSINENADRPLPPGFNVEIEPCLVDADATASLGDTSGGAAPSNLLILTGALVLVGVGSLIVVRSRRRR